MILPNRLALIIDTRSKEKGICLACKTTVAKGYGPEAINFNRPPLVVLKLA